MCSGVSAFDRILELGGNGAWNLRFVFFFFRVTRWLVDALVKYFVSELLFSNSLFFTIGALSYFVEYGTYLASLLPVVYFLKSSRAERMLLCMRI